MKNQIFKNAEFGQIRTCTVDGETYFVGKDVASALGYKNTKDALMRHVDEDDKLGSGFTTSGQNREMTVINESGLYVLIRSTEALIVQPYHLPKTEECAFRDWDEYWDWSPQAYGE